MRKWLVICLLTGLCNIVKAQETDEMKNLISGALYSINVNHSVCTENADFPAFLIKELDIYLKTDTLLHLSVEERKELQFKLLASQHVPKWTENSVAGIPIIKNDTVKKVMGDSSKLWDYFKMKYPEPFMYTLYFFTKPIFIRNNSICFFYFDEGSHPRLEDEALLGGSSSGEFCIYIKTGNEWVKKITVFRYIT